MDNYLLILILVIIFASFFIIITSCKFPRQKENFKSSLEDEKKRDINKIIDLLNREISNLKSPPGNFQVTSLVHIP